MKFEVDASLHIASQHPSKFSDLQREFKVRHWPDQASISIELIEDRPSENIEQAISSFFEVLDQYNGVKDLGGSLRVAAYFSPDEVAAFSVALSQEVIRQLWKYQMDIEVIGYPCSD